MTGKTDFSQINAELENLENNASRYKNTNKTVDWWNLPKGDSSLLVLPPSKDGAPLFKKVTIFHGYVDSQGKKRCYKSSLENHGECPLLDNYKRLKETNPDRAKEVRPQTVFLYNVRDANGKNRVLSANTSQHKEILAELQNAHLEGIDATDPRQGYTVTVSRLTATPWARARLARKPITLTEDQIQESLSGLYELEGLYQDFTPDELKKMLNGEDIVNYGKKEDDSSGNESSAQVAKSEQTQSSPQTSPQQEKLETSGSAQTASPSEAPQESKGDDDIDDIMSILDE